MRIAMWSGPRNLSTAMMYSFGARADCAVWDEPFYGAYLARSGLDHPLSEKIKAACGTDMAALQNLCIGAPPHDKAVFYQKHMVHHLGPSDELDWIENLTNVFLIRHPARVIASYHAKREHPTLADIGFQEQMDLIDWLTSRGHSPIVIDSADIRQNPRGMLQSLCSSIGLEFDPAMLNWPKGGHPQDGVWASHWYGAVWKSTGFAGAEGPLPEVPQSLRPVLDQALPLYRSMAALKITAR